MSPSRPREFSPENEVLIATTPLSKCRCPFCRNPEFYNEFSHYLYPQLSDKERWGFYYEICRLVDSDYLHKMPPMSKISYSRD